MVIKFIVFDGNTYDVLNEKDTVNDTPSKIFNAINGKIRHINKKDAMAALYSLVGRAWDNIKKEDNTKLNFDNNPVYHLSRGNEEKKESFTVFYYITDRNDKYLTIKILLLGEHEKKDPGYLYNIFWREGSVKELKNISIRTEQDIANK